MDETLKNWLLGICATAVGVVIGAVNQWWFTKRAERREIQRILINLKGEAEGRGMLILKAGRDLTTAHWTLVHRRWQDKNPLVELPKGTNVRPEHTELILIAKMKEEVVTFQNIVAELRIYISQFSTICKDKQIMESYMKVQNYDPLIYNPIVDMSEKEYMNHLLTNMKGVMNKVNNDLGKVFDELFGKLEEHIQKHNS